MSDTSIDSSFIPHPSSFSLPVPIPRVPVTVRAATMDDLPFMDALQKAHARNLGYFPTKQFQGYVQMGAVLIAEDATSGRAIGYCISRDRYLKRDELGVIYQLCVAPGAQRKLVGASLLREVFERSAYGCRLYCCWCAQDIDANRFWESMGFVPIAFRAGSSGKKRVHIFWQKRIVDGDEQTEWWYPFQTSGGAIRADRIVFPIPPGTHWSEVTAVAAPTTEPALSRQLPSETSEKTARRSARSKRTKPALRVLGGIRFASDAPPEPSAKPRAAKKTRAPAAAKIDPKFLKSSRDLRDVWMERVNADPSLLVSQGRYEVRRVLPAPAGAGEAGEGRQRLQGMRHTRQLKAA